MEIMNFDDVFGERRSSDVETGICEQFNKNNMSPSDKKMPFGPPLVPLPTNTNTVRALSHQVQYSSSDRILSINHLVPVNTN